jgi:hypothetical protein
MSAGKHHRRESFHLRNAAAQGTDSGNVKKKYGKPVAEVPVANLIQRPSPRRAQKAKTNPREPLISPCSLCSPW